MLRRGARRGVARGGRQGQRTAAQRWMATAREPEQSPKRLIINCDDFGSALCANDGVEAALSRGIATSTTLMVPCAWAFDAAGRARAHPEWGVGVHLTHTAEWPRYRWRPLLGPDRVPGLYGPDGFMWPTVPEVYGHATADEALAEGTAQIEQALAWGLHPTHIDSHMGVMQLDPAFYDAYLALAARFGLPVRMPGPDQIAAARMRFAWADQVHPKARALGIRFPDGLLYGSAPGTTDEAAKAHVLRLLSGIAPGTTEMLFHPAAAGPELAAMISSGGLDRVRDLRLLTEDADVRRLLTAGGIQLVDFRALASS